MSQASAHANTEFEYIATSIDAFTKAAGLPLYNLRDISYDLSTIMRHNTDFIWVLREQGTVIEPIRRGVNPASLNYLLSHSASASKVKIFHITNNCQSIVPVKASRALELMNLPPCDLSADMPITKLINSVNAILADGVKESYWLDMSTSAASDDRTHDWEAYQKHFSRGHPLMSDFMDKAIQLKEAGKLV